MRLTSLAMSDCFAYEAWPLRLHWEFAFFAAKVRPLDVLRDEVEPFLHVEDLGRMLVVAEPQPVHFQRNLICGRKSIIERHCRQGKHAKMPRKSIKASMRQVFV